MCRCVQLPQAVSQMDFVVQRCLIAAATAPALRFLTILPEVLGATLSTRTLAHALLVPGFTGLCALDIGRQSARATSTP